MFKKTRKEGNKA